ncbi:hypothetical protein [Pseudomonas sp. Sample_23]|uniref:hypothetical protein n=1 Tax=Pseudomonas sp. Sample_23 TaxID=2448267 RepID=UPI001032E13D|nr:hypothetical protein [Pseudomonas sp. Sample_23]
MPRRNGTKKQRAAELLSTATRGPDMGLTFTAAGLSPEQKKVLEAELADRYRLWSRTWLLPELRRLVPELAKLAASDPAALERTHGPYVNGA